MKEKIKFCAYFLLFYLIVVNVLNCFGFMFKDIGIEEFIANIRLTLLILGPLAGSAVLAVLVSEISDKRRYKNVQENERQIKQDPL